MFIQSQPRSPINKFKRTWRQHRRRTTQGRRHGESIRTRCRTRSGQFYCTGTCGCLAHPRDELDKVVVERDTGLGVEDGRLGGSDKVGRDNLVLGVAIPLAVCGLADEITTNPRMPLSSGVSEAFLMTALISSYEAPFSILQTKSTTETSAVGTRKDMPVSLPFRAGMTLPTA
jgi:hypothetical protein